MKHEQEFDLVVVGGGTAGALCALAAASQGLRVAVADRGGCLGGMSTCSGLTEMNAAGFQGAPLYHGIERKLFDTMVQQGSAEYHFGVPMSSNPQVKIDRLRFDPEQFKLLLEEQAVHYGVSLFYGAELENACETPDMGQVTLRLGEKRSTLLGNCLVDGTGNARLVQSLGAPTEKAAREQLMIATLMFRLGGVRQKVLAQFLDQGKLPAVIEEGVAAGVLKSRILAITPIPGTADVSLNVTRTQCDHEDPLEVSRALIEARSQIRPVLRFVKARIPGLEQAYIASIAPVLGVRDARRIRGQQRLTLADLEQMTHFADSIACGCYPVDVHDPATGTVLWKMLPGVYHIPFRSVLPQGPKRTLVAGKCLCADRQAFGAVRTMPTMMNLGESVGYAAALAKERGCALAALDGVQLHRRLTEIYGVEP